ncbi:MAG: sugar transferase [Bacteroides sp.]|nr:sugar transferase [Lachnospiraceae bacterium]MCM1332887.1 sugar transferase [Bacteroides sp.]MCM1390438.1 sugar transferase [Bacteroides sp.]
MYIAGDFLSTNIAVGLFAIARYYIDDASRHFGSLWLYLQHGPVVEEQLLFPLGMLFIYWLSGYYNRVFMKSRLQELEKTFSNCFAGTVVFFFIALINDLRPDRIHTYLLLLLLFGLLFVCVYPIRRMVSRIGRKRVESGVWAINTIVVGCDEESAAIAARLEKHRIVMGYRVVGYLDVSGGHCAPSCHPLFSMNDIEEVIRRYDVKAFVVASIKRTESMQELVNRLLPTGCSVLISPDTYEMLTTRIRTSNVSGEPLVDLSSSNISESALNVKRVFDVVFSVIGLILSAPIVGVLALAVKFDSPGNVIFKQERIGRHKKPFTMYKLRTMVADAEASGPALSVANDPRVTRIGAVMRKYRLDELPQFWNILRGDMSFVGPRPERRYYVEQLCRRFPAYALIHQVKPGLTSWGMVKYGYASDIDEMIERLRYDLIYLDNVSLGVDMKILIYTFRTVLTGKGI